MNGRQLADRLQVSQGHVSRLRSGARLPSIALMWAICDALDWSPESQMVAIRKQTFHDELNARLTPDTPETQEEQVAA